MKNTFSMFLAGIGIAFLLIFFYFLFDGLDYYLLPLQERPWHDAYTLLKPGGLWGHGFGVAGSFFLILLLGYSLKKRTRLFSKAGTMRQWMSAHIVLGVAGPLLICLHTTGKLNGIISVAFWAMLFVMLSGFFGRYIYGQIPRTLEGRTLSKEEAAAKAAGIRRELMQIHQLDEDEIRAIEHIILNAPHTDEAVKRRRIYRLIPFRAGKKKALIQSRFRLPAGQLDTIYNNIAAEARLEQQVNVWDRMQRIFYYWHVVHKPFAVIMYLILAVHAGMSIWLGYHWIF